MPRKPEGQAVGKWVQMGGGKYTYLLVSQLSLGNLVGKVGDYEIYEQGEVFYRAMSEKHYNRLLKGEGVIPTGETFTSPTLEYIQNGTKTGDGYDGIIVKFKVKRGTLEEFKKKAVRHENLPSNKLKEIFGENVPDVLSGGWNTKYAQFKTETYTIKRGMDVSDIPQVNIGLGRESPYPDIKSALDIFNESIIEFQKVN